MDYASKLNGRIYLDELEPYTHRDQKGRRFIYADIEERREVSQYGDTHNVSVWSKENGKKYIGNFRPRQNSQYGDSSFNAPKTPQNAQQAPSAVPTHGDDLDMPF